MKPGTRMFMDWARAATARLAGVLEPLPAPLVTATGVAGGVALAWDEIPNAGVYLCFEADHVGEIDFPFAVVRAKDVGRNGAVRSGATDTDSRFYYVQAVSPLGVLGNLSDPVEQGAGSAVNLTGLDDLILPTSIQLFREDFLTGDAAANVFQTGFLGMAALTTAGTFQNGIFPYTGIFRIAITGGTPAAGTSINLSNTGSTMGGLGKVWNQPGALYSNGDVILPAGSLTGWHLVIIFRFVDNPVATTVGFAAGFSSDQANFTTVTGSTDCFGIRQRNSIGHLEIYQHKGHGQAAQLPPTIHNLVWKDALGTPAAIADTNWHRLDIISANGPQEVLRHGSIYLFCSIDGRAMAENFFNGDPWIADTGAGDNGALTRNMSFHFGVTKDIDGSSQTRSVEFDYVAMQFTRQQPINPVFPRWFLEAPVSP
jgi:hypothetical protein